MKKFKNWTKKPITWGGYLKLCGVSTLISVVMMTPFWVSVIKDSKEIGPYELDENDEETEQ